MKKVLITGATGFAGSFLTQYLASRNEYDLYGTSRSETDELKNIAQIVPLDLTKKDEVDTLIKNVQPDTVFHLAAFPSPADSLKDPSGYLHNNIDAELFLLEAIKNSGLLSTRVLIISSAEVYGLINPSDLPIDEQTPMRPVNPYGVSKIAQDYLGLQYALAYKLPVIRARPFGHIGPKLSDQFATSAFSKKIAEIEKGKREPVLTVGNLDSKRDLTDVRDIVRAYVALVEKGESGEAYNIGRGESYQTKHVLDILLSLSSHKIEVKTDPALLRPTDIPELRCDNSKLVNLTGWKPEISLEQSLKDTLEYWRGVV